MKRQIEFTLTLLLEVEADEEIMPNEFSLAVDDHIKCVSAYDVKHIFESKLLAAEVNETEEVFK
jgi:hypothetical protein